MKQISLGEYLGSQKRKSEEAFAAQETADSDDVDDIDPSAEVDIKCLEKEWYGRGYETGLREGRVAAKEQYERAIIEHSEGTQRQIIDHLVRVRAGILREFVTARSELEALVANALSALFKKVVAQRTHNEICATTRQLLNNGSMGVLTISASGETITLLQTRLSDLENSISYIETEHADVVISFDQTTIRSHIDAWIEKIDQLTKSETVGGT